jgi:uncharacterized membrane protein YsdA (DUF1294 family)/cold shock CspA family protein
MAKAESSVNGEQRGVVVKFNSERGFGFIRPSGVADQSTRDVFVHISEVANRRDLHPGQHVRYRVKRTEKGPTAVDVHAGSVLGVPILKYGLLGLGLAASVLVGVGLILGWPDTAGLWLALWVMGASLANFVLFGYDKRQAPRGGERVPEVILQGLSLLGGWLGALIGMRVFHHKTIKREFQVVFWLIFAVQMAVLLYLLLR